MRARNAATREVKKAAFSNIDPVFKGVQTAINGLYGSKAEIAPSRMPEKGHIVAPSVAAYKDSVNPQIGLIVFEPVADCGLKPEDADLAAGCADYLEVQVAGQPLFGQTPLVTSLQRAVRELKLANGLRLGSAEAEHVARITGASEFYVGKSARPNASGAINISYQLFELTGTTGSRSVGKPVSTDITPETLANVLPSFAASLARAAGASDPKISKSSSLPAAAVAALGRSSFNAKPSASDVALIRASADNDAALMMFILAKDRNVSGTVCNTEVTTLLTRLAPENPLAWAHAAYYDPAMILQFGDKLAALRSEYPRSYPLSHTAVWVDRVAADAQGERLAAEAAVKNAPRNPDAWLSVGRTLSTEADVLRQGRFSNSLSGDEQAYLDKLYAVWEEAVKQAVNIDPQHEVAWTRLIDAGVFAGGANSNEVVDAYEKAKSFSFDKAELYETAIQMFQPQWGGSASDLARVVDDASKTDFPDIKNVGEISSVLRDVRLADKADSILARNQARVEANLKANPNDPQAHWQMASLLFFQSKKEQACDEYQKVTELLPDNVQAHYDYAKALDLAGDRPLEISEYEKVLKLDPLNIYAPVDLGIALKQVSRNSDAEKFLTLGLKRYPASFDGHYGLGELCLNEKRYSEAATEFRKVMNIGSVGPLVYAYRVLALDGAKRYDEAESVGEEGLSTFAQVEDRLPDLARPISLLHSSLAYAYLKAHKFPDAEKQNDAASTLDSENSSAVINQGYVFDGLGERGKARKQWLAAQSMSLDSDSRDEVKHDLAAYPENGK